MGKAACTMSQHALETPLIEAVDVAGQIRWRAMSASLLLTWFFVCARLSSNKPLFTTSVLQPLHTDYAIDFEGKESANGQFFFGAQIAVGL